MASTIKTYHFVSIFIVSGGKFIISDGKFIVLSKILDTKNNKNSGKFIVFIIFHVKIQHKTLNLLFCVVFAMIKLA